jgi:hypothetical protein
MTPDRTGPPQEAYRVATDAVAWLAEHGGLAARLPEGAAAGDLELSRPHEELFLGLDDLIEGRGLAAAKSGGWRYLVAHAGTPLASAATVTEESGATRFAQLDYGPFVHGTTAALRTAADLPDGGSEPARVVVVPALGFVAAWVEPATGGSVLVPAAPAPEGVTAGRAYPADELLPVLTELAIRMRSDEDGVGA